MSRIGAGGATARSMGHVPISGPEGTLSSFANIRGRKVYVHINNTNPVLIEDSPERREVERNGFEIGADGREFTFAESPVTDELWNAEEVTARLKNVGPQHYHHQHPVHRLMNAGRLSPEQIRGWVANRCCAEEPLA